VIGAALAAAARGAGYRRIARLLGVPADTVRGWLRRFAGRAGQVRDAFARVAAAVSADPVPLAPAGSAVADAVVAVAAAAEAIGRRWPRLLLTVSPWEVACAVTNASLMAPVIMVRAVNTSSPLPAGGR
jgi:transposase-like protein